MNKHKILWYYIFTLICAVILGGTAGAIFKTSVPEQYAASMAMAQMSPMCGLMLLCIFCKDWRHFKRMQWNPFKNRKNILWMITALLIPAVIIIIATSVLSLTGKKYIANGYGCMEIVIIVIASIIGCIGEEIGWRGFMLPAYNKKYSLFLSAVFTGMLWGAWHFGKISLYGIGGYLLFIVMITEFSIIMAWIYNKTKGNLAAMILFHSSINITSVFLLTKREGIPFYIIGCVVSAVICLIVILNSKKEFLKKHNSAVLEKL